MERISGKLKQRFCKDCNIPINIFAEPYFLFRIYQFNDIYGTVEKYHIFLNEIKKYSCEQDYFEEYNKIKDCAICTIKDSEGFKKFNNLDMNQFAISDEYKSITSNAIYHNANDGRRFISIDMKKANFTALNNYDKSIFNSGTWEDFIKKFTDNEHIIQSKYIRQVILGNCNPRRQVTYARYLTSRMIPVLEKVDSAIFATKNIVSLASDEIVYDVSEHDETRINSLINIVESFPEMNQFECTYFTLYDVAEYAYIKKFNDKKIKIKCAEVEFLPYIIRRIGTNQDCINYDLYFTFKGQLAKFDNFPDKLVNFEWEKFK